MSRVECIQVSALAAAVAAPVDDPRQQHLAECPRCQALAIEFDGFMAARAGDVDLTVPEISRLDQALAREIAGEAEDAEAPQSNSKRTTGFRWPAWWVTVPALAAVLALALFFPASRVVGPSPNVMRGDEPVEANLVSHPAQVAGANLVLTWEAAPAADSYAVQFLFADLTVSETVPVGPDSSFVLPLATIATPADARFWRVTGFRDGDAVVRSGLRELPQ